MNYKAQPSELAVQQSEGVKIVIELFKNCFKTDRGASQTLVEKVFIDIESQAYLLRSTCISK